MKDGTTPWVSLVVATRGRKSELDRLLASLRTQTYRHFRVMVADQNPSGFLDETLEPYAGSFLLERIAAPLGASAARNACLTRELDDIIGFPDDDCWYEPDTLEQVVSAFCLHGGDAVVGVSPTWRGYRPDTSPAGLGRVGLLRGTPTWAYFIRREAASGIGDFDETLGPGSRTEIPCAEDTDYLLRMHSGGFVVHRCPAVHVHHPEPMYDAPGLERKAHAYGYARAHLLCKHRYGMLMKMLNALHLLAYALLPGAGGRRRYYRAMLRGYSSRLLGK